MKDSTLYKTLVSAWIVGAVFTLGISGYIIYLIISALNKYIGG